MPGSGSGAAWISSVAATLLALFCTALLARACDTFPDSSFYNVLVSSVGKWCAAIFAGILTLLALLTCVVSMTVFSRFVQITALPQTPRIILPLLIIIVAALSLSGGMESATGATRLLFWFTAGVFVLFVALGLTQIYPQLLLPERIEAKSVFRDTGEIFLNRFAQIPAFMAIYTRMSEPKTRKKYMLGAVGGAGLSLAVISAITTAMLGAESTKVDFYPVYTAMSLHSVGGFIQHTEIFACIAMTLCLFFKGCVCLLFSGDMLDGIFKISRRRGVFLPLALICAYATQLFYRDVSSLRGMLEWKSGAIYILLLNIIIPFVIFCTSFIKRKKTD